jgi:hypothetical protein
MTRFEMKTVLDKEKSLDTQLSVIMSENKKIVQGSFFEEDYLIRTLGSLATSPEVALTEIVANSWDAGATHVDILIPEKIGDKLTIEDNGVGLTKEEFYTRWMTLGYNRLKHQSKNVEFPDENSHLKRIAYGRNGIGRHGMLCFNNEYSVISEKNGRCSKFLVTTRSEKEPFLISTQEFKNSNKHGLRLEVIVERNLPTPSRMLQVISARFLHDPNFSISINRQSLDLEELQGLVSSETLILEGKVKLDIKLVDSQKARRSTIYQGIAFWQNGKLVGEPAWVVGKITVLDGRSKEAKRYSVIVQSNDLAAFVKEDWTGFKRDPELDKIFVEIDKVVQGMFERLARISVGETTKQIKEEFREQYNELSPLAKYEFNEVLDNIASTKPTAKQESISLAVEAVLNLEKTRSGTELLQKFSRLSHDDIDGLIRLLDNWSIKDALTVLDEIDKRLSIVEAIRSLSGDSSVDELHVLHPLIASARWIFGPEFDSPEYSSNSQLQKTVEKVFGKKIDKSAFANNKKRPDLVSLSHSTLSVTGTSIYDSNSITTVEKVLLIELKKGGSNVGREERNQAVGYVEDFMNCGSLIGSPYISAFVVGDTSSERILPVQSISNQNGVEMGKVQVCLFSQLVDSAERRLFNLRTRLSERYSEFDGVEFVSRQITMEI